MRPASRMLSRLFSIRQCRRCPSPPAPPAFLPHPTIHVSQCPCIHLCRVTLAQEVRGAENRPAAEVALDSILSKLADVGRPLKGACARVRCQQGKEADGGIGHLQGEDRRGGDARLRRDEK